MAQSGSERRHLVEVDLSVFVVGQVVHYMPSSSYTFSNPAGAVLHPASDYVCIVTIRQASSTPAVHVAVPCGTAWDMKISRHEFVVRWCHGLPEGGHPYRRSARFRTHWSELVISDVDDAKLTSILLATFVPTNSDPTVDFGVTPIALLSVFGRAISVTPLHDARHYVGHTRPGDRVGSDVDSESDSESSPHVLAVGF